jgi:alkaline phosphatase D
LVPINTDQWGGYQADQMELLRYIKSNRIGNTVFLTGDIHSSWGNELPADFRTYPQTRDSVAVFGKPRVWPAPGPLP